MSQKCLDCGKEIPKSSWKVRCRDCYYKNKNNGNSQSNMHQCPHVSYEKFCTGEDCQCCEIFAEIQGEMYGIYNNHY
jgi:hypothetical protein